MYPPPSSLPQTAPMSNSPLAEATGIVRKARREMKRVEGSIVDLVRDGRNIFLLVEDSEGYRSIDRVCLGVVVGEQI